MPEPQQLNIFNPGSVTYDGLERAQKFFENHVDNVTDRDRAVLWFTEELGEAAAIIRREEEEHYTDAVGDLLMWCITLARLLDVNAADALRYSTRQLVAKGYSNLDPGSIEVD